MPYIGNVTTDFDVSTANLNDQSVTAVKLSPNVGSNGQVLGVDGSGNLQWTSDPAGQWVTTGNNIYFSGGLVGIATNSPTGTLTVHNTDDANINVLECYNDNGNMSGSFSQTSTGDGTVGVRTNAGTLSVFFRSNGISYINGGNVGIGESSPTFKTEITVNDTNAYSSTSMASSQTQLRINNAGASGVAGILLTAEPSSGSAGYTSIRTISPSSGSGDLIFSTRNASNFGERVRIQYDGKVGIGTTSPGVNLHVKGTGTDIFKVESTDAGAQGTNLILQHSPGAGNMAADDVISLLQFNGVDDSNNPTTYASIRTVATSIANNSEQGDLTFWTRSGNNFLEKVRIQSDGDVGIGTTSPGYKLELSGTNNNSYLSLENTTAADTDGSRYSRLLFRGTQSGGEISSLAAINGAHDGTADDQKGILTFRTNDGNDGESPTVRMSIDSDGNVGIGTTSPEEVLDLSDSSQINLKIGSRGYIGQAYSTAATILGHSVKAKTTGTTSGGMIITETNSGGGAPSAIRQESGTIQFHTAASGTADTDFNSNERMRIDASGDVGIGTTSPDSKLHIQSADSRGHQNLLELKHTNTNTGPAGGNDGDGPALLFNGYYDNSNAGVSNEWAFAKIAAENKGSGYGSNLKFYVHPADGNQTSSVVEALTITGDGSSGANTTFNGLIKTSVGIQFQGQTNSSATGATPGETTLDHYEEGTWTPYFAAQSGTAAGYTTQVGSYTRIGRMVYAQFAVKLDGKGTLGGSYSYLKGMPFNHAGSRAGAGTIYYIDNLNTAVSSLSYELGGSSPTVAWLTGIAGTSDTETDYIDPSYFTDTTHFEGLLIYRVD